MNSNRWRRPRKLKGIGDIVAIVAQPIAETIDKVLKTNVAGCGGCQKRKEFLNNLIPFDDKDEN